MRNYTPLEEALDRLWSAEDSLEARDAAAELAEMILAGFRVRNRHLLALADHALWSDSGPTQALGRLAQTVAWLTAERDVGPEAYLGEARRELDRLLDSRRIEDDAAHRVPLDALELADSTPDPGAELDAQALEADLLAFPDLTDGERRIMRARIALGPGALGRDIARHAGLTTGSEREITRRLRAKLRPLVDKSARSMPVHGRGPMHATGAGA